MKITRHQLHRCVAGLTLAGLPLIGIALAPNSFAQPDFDCLGSVSLDCMMDSGGGLPGGGSAPDPTAGWYQPGNLVIPATGGPPQIAVAPAPPGGPVVTSGGGVVVPAGPPIG